MSDVITFVSHTNKPGGGELSLRRYLERTRLNVRLVTMEAGGIWSGMKCEVVHAVGLLGLRRALRGTSSVVANSMRAALLATLVAPRRTQIIYWVRDGLKNSAMSELALTVTMHLTARRVSHYLANSKWTASTIHDALGVEPDRIHVVYSMCGVTQSRLDHIALQAPRQEESLRLLFLGRLAPWKGPDVAIRALARLRERGVEATLTVAGAALFGEDAYAATLARLIADEPNARLIGHVEDVQGLLASHDVLVHCSVVPEPFGQVIIQSLGAGLPVVATESGGPVEILSGAPSNPLYRPGDVNSLVTAILRVLTVHAEYRAWARRRVMNFTDEILLSHTDSTFEELTRGST